MIKASELRIGNLVEYQSIAGNYVNDIPKWTLLEILSVDILGVEEFSDHYRPVPITEEWLLKFGFALDNERIKSSNYVEYAIGNFILASHNRIDYWILLGTEVKIKSVHKLQNTYHIFKDKELKLK